MSSLMTCGAVLALVSRSSEGNPNALKKRADSARSLTGRLTAILVVIGRSFPIGEDARYTLKHWLSDSASDFAFMLRAWPPTMLCVAPGRAPASAGRRYPPRGPAGPRAANTGAPSAAVPLPTVLAFYAYSTSGRVCPNLLSRFQKHQADPGQLPGSFAKAGTDQGAAWADRPAGSAMAESRWPVAMTAVLPSRPGMPLLSVLIVFIVRWHGRPVRCCRDVRRGLSALFRRA